jgi:hypothetical protein
MAWFHCGRCASLFRAQAGDIEDRRCSSCGENPVLAPDIQPVPAAGMKTARDPMLRVKMAEVEKPTIFKREIRQHKGRHFTLKLVVVWALLMAVLAICSKLFWSKESQEARTESSQLSVADRNSLILEKEYPKCVQVMSGFISAGTPEAKNQFVLNPLDTVRKMARFYHLNPIESIDPMSVRGVSNGLITLGNGTRLIETRWMVSDGRIIDAVFAQQDGEWRLDWEDFVRFSDEPWALFLAGTEDGEGEFRLLARERDGGERGSVGNLRIHLHAPVFGKPGEAGEASQEFVIDQLSPEGQMLAAAFKERAAGSRIHASKLETLDPGNMIRVRVKVSRKNGVDGRDFKITRLEACDWLAADR